MKIKIVNFLKSLILKEGNKISVSKAAAWFAGLCVTIANSQAIFVANNVAIPADWMPIFQYAGVVSAIYALIKTRDSKAATPAIPEVEQPKSEVK
jgi:hypothetical protein